MYHFTWPVINDAKNLCSALYYALALGIVCLLSSSLFKIFTMFSDSPQWQIEKYSATTASHMPFDRWGWQLGFSHPFCFSYSYTSSDHYKHKWATHAFFFLEKYFVLWENKRRKDCPFRFFQESPERVACNSHILVGENTCSILNMFCTHWQGKCEDQVLFIAYLKSNKQHLTIGTSFT